jgi:hypothetical protein
VWRARARIGSRTRRERGRAHGKSDCKLNRPAKSQMPRSPEIPGESAKTS